METFIFTHSTMLEVTENKERDTKKGQKEVWTARNGLMNIKEF